MVSLYLGEIEHLRLQPQRHYFYYNFLFFRFNLDAQRTAADHFPLLSRNRWGLFSLYDSDFLGATAGNLRSAVEGVLAKSGVTSAFPRIDCICGARFLGYAFNPVTFFLCFDAAKRLRISSSAFCISSAAGSSGCSSISKDRPK